MELYLRKANMDDAQDILLWRNDKTTRENSFSKGKISLISHMDWFVRKLDNPDCLMFMMMEGKEKVGHIRVDINGDIGEISYMIAPGSRGKGYGKKILELVEKEISGRVVSLMGLTLKENRASGRCFEVNGYNMTEAEDAYCYSKSIR